VARQLLLHWEKNFFTLVECVRNKKGRWLLHREATHDLSQESDQDLLHQQALDQLQTTLTAWDVRKASLHCLLPAEKIFLKTLVLEIPANLEDLIQEIVRLEAKKVFPVPLEELIWNFQIFPSHTKGKISILYAAIKKKSIAPLLEMNFSTELTRIFHTDWSRGAANPDADTTGSRETAVETALALRGQPCKGETSGSERVNEGDGLQRRLYVSYCPRSNSRLTQYPSAVRKPQQNRDEISGLNIQTISSTTQALCESLQLINQNQETTLIIDINGSLPNVILMKPQEIIISYTLEQRAVGSSQLGKIDTDLSRILEQATSQKMIPTQIVVTGKSAQKNQLLLLLQKKYQIPIKDLDELLLNHLSWLPTTPENLENKSGFSRSYVAGAIHFFTKKNRNIVAQIFHNHQPQRLVSLMDTGLNSKSSSGNLYSRLCHQTSSRAFSHQVSQPPCHHQYEIFDLNLLPPSLVAKQKLKKQQSYILGVMTLITCTLLLGSLTIYDQTSRLITATSQATFFLTQEEKRLLSLDQEIASFQKVEEKNGAWFRLLQAHAAWPRVIQEIQKALPKRYLWITQCSASDDQKNIDKTSSLTAINLEGLYLENPRQADVVDDFVEKLKKSDFFDIKKQEKQQLLCSPNDGSAYAYPWKLRVPFKSPMNFNLNPDISY
jgi:hypothetical protein